MSWNKMNVGALRSLTSKPREFSEAPANHSSIRVFDPCLGTTNNLAWCDSCETNLV